MSDSRIDIVKATSNSFPKRAANLLLSFTLIIGVASVGDHVDAQEEKVLPSRLLNPLQPKLTGESDVPKLASMEKQKQFTQSIYNATKTAKTAKDFTALIAQCETALGAGLSKTNKSYVASIKGWAFNRRGEARLAVAQQFKSIGSTTQFKKAYDLAVEDFDSGLINDPSRHRSWNSRGLAKMVAEDWKNAARDFSEATKLKPDYAVAWFNRAEALFQLEKFELAIKDYNTAISLVDEDPQALTGRGHCYLALGQEAKAISDFQAVIEQAPGNPMAQVNLGDALDSFAKTEEALEAYRTAEKLAKASAKTVGLTPTLVAQQRIAWVLATCKEDNIRKPGDSLDTMTAMIQTHGETAPRLETLAAAQAAVGKFDAAKRSQQNAIRLANSVRLASSEEIPDDNPSKVRLSLYEQETANHETEK